MIDQAEERDIECVCIVSPKIISETGWVVDSGGTVVRYNLPTLQLCADEWQPHSTSNWIIWKAFSSMSALVMQSAHTAHCKDEQSVQNAVAPSIRPSRR